MTVASTTNRVDYTGNGSTTVFSFTFRIFDNADLVVTTADTDGVETTLVLDTDYTVTGAGSYSGGSITLATALTSGHALTIQRVLDITQETDLRNQGQFFAETHEDVFDRMVMINQQLQEQIDRAAKLPVTSTTDAEQLTADITVLAGIIDELTALYNALSDIQTVADDLNEATSEIEVVAGAIANVNTVGSNISNVNTVAGISSNVTTVAGKATEVTTVAGIASAVSGVAAISTAVSAVNSNATNINAVNANKTNIDAVAGNATNINAVAGNETNITAVKNNATNINTVAGKATEITAVAGISGDVTTVAGIASDVAAVENISANVTTVAGISTAVSTVATNNTNVSTVATNISAINTVATDIAQIITTANDLNEAVSEIDTVATNISAVNTVGTAISDVSAVAAIAADVSTAADNVADIQNFADVYQGAKSSAPTLRNDGSALQAGDLYFYTGTGTKEMKVYNGSSWIAVGSSVNGILAQFKYVATASQTSFSGTDANGLTLAYDAGFIIVFLNGVRLDAADYTASNGTTVVLGSGAAANDEVVIVAFGNFSLANHYTKAEDDALLAAKASKAGDTFTGDVTLSQAGSGRTLSIINTSDSNRGFMARTGVNKVQVGTNSSVYDLEWVIDGNAKGKIDTNFQRHSVIPNGSTLYPAFDCRAWVNFNGQGTVAIRGSGNVSSITDNGTGNYTVNFATAMPDSNYSISGFGGDPDGSGGDCTFIRYPADTYTSSAVQVRNVFNAVGYDVNVVCVQVFR